MKSKKHPVTLSICLLLVLMVSGGLIQHATATVSPAESKATGFDVSYVIQNDWGRGALINITIKNTGTVAINNWRLTWNFPGNQKITNMWGASFTQNNTAVTIKNNPYNKTISAGRTISFGFLISYSGTNNKPASFTLNNISSTTATMTPTATATPGSTASITTIPTSTAPTTSNDYKNPDDYINKTTVTVLSKSNVNIANRTSEFKGLVADCTKVALAYADPAENANPAYNSSKSGAASFAAYIFGYDSTSNTEFLNAKKYVPYVLNKIYYTPKYKSTWYKTLVDKNGGVFIILEKAANMNGLCGVKFGNTNDGFGMRLGAGCMSTSSGRHVLFHEMSHCIWDTTGTTNDFYVGIDPRTKINYGTGNLITLFNKLYNDSIRSNTFYSGSYGWNYSHENFAESAAKFFTKDFQTKLQVNDPVVYNILSQIYTKFNF